MADGQQERRSADRHRYRHGRYGTPRLVPELRAAGTRVRQRRVARLMRADGLVAERARRRIITTDSAHGGPSTPNLLARQFTITDHPVPNTAWRGVPYVLTRERWLCLSVLLVLASRRVVGWATCDTLATDGPLAALPMALRARRPARGADPAYRRRVPVREPALPGRGGRPRRATEHEPTWRLLR